MTLERTCPMCEEPIWPGETFVEEMGGNRLHKVCLLRSVVGSVAHQERRCSCYVAGSEEGDPEGMTRKQAAEAAVELWEKKMMLTTDSCENP